MTSPYATPFQAVNAEPQWSGWGVRTKGGQMLAVGMTEGRAKQMARECNQARYEEEADTQEDEQ